MKFGIFYELSVQKPWNRQSELRVYQEALEQVELADELGFDQVWAVEHHFLEEYSHCSAPEVFLAAAAARTKRIHVGHGIVLCLPQVNHPARIAERAAALDLVSNGRLEFGCRYNMFPAGFAVASLTDNPKVLAAGLLERGCPTTLGTIAFEATTESARAILADETGSLLGVEFPALQTIEPGRLVYDHVNAFRTTGKNGSSRADLVVISPDLEISHAAISKSARITYSSTRESVWHALRARQVISAQVVRGIRTFAAATAIAATQNSTNQAQPQPGAKIEFTSLQQIFAGLPLVFNKEAAKGLTTIYQFDLTGEKSAQYYVTIANETCTVQEGTHSTPHMTLSMAGQDYLDLVNGKLNPQMAFMSGKMKISGDMSLAMKMASLFPRPA